MYITSIEIKNLRCFEEAELTFQYPGREIEPPLRFPNINLLLGNNGAGKTTTLKAIALSVLAPMISQSGLIPYRLIRRDHRTPDSIKRAEVTASVLMHEQDLGIRVWPSSSELLRIIVEQVEEDEYFEFVDPKRYAKDWTSQWRSLFSLAQSPAFLVVGYGATRQIEDAEKLDLTARRKTRLLRYERVAGLFENHIALIPLNVWLPNFRKENPGRHKQVVNLINRLLPEGASFNGEFEEGEYWFEVNGTKAPFGALSDGYRAYIGWIADLLYHICMGAPKGAKLVDNRGIVLVDEIDLHLHPEWQRTVIATISETLPNLQFVFTTHSPIVAGSVNKENIFVMETMADGASVVKQYDEQIYGLNAEQVLLSSYFNLKTTRAGSFVDELKTLSVKAGKGDLEAALEFMEKLSGQEATKNGTARQPAKITASRKKTKKSSAPAKAKRKR